MKYLQNFLSEESGNVTVLGLGAMTLMIGVGGLAVDSMRFEHQRVKVQNALDNCALIATALKKTRDYHSVAEDCMTKSGLPGILLPNDGSDGGLSANLIVDALFPNATGLTGLDAVSQSAAEKKAFKTEISLVLDVSGSMERPINPTDPVSELPINKLKVAAKDFVETVLTNGKDISISLVPYSGAVNLGPTMRGLYNTIDDNGRAGVDCLDVPASAFDSLSFDHQMPMAMTTYFDMISPTSTGWVDPTSTANLNGATRLDENTACNVTPGNVVRVAQTDIATLKTAIDALTPAGSTSIDTGMRWGLSFLDPSANSLFASLSALNQIDPKMANRPLPYSPTETIKIAILMTDGENANERQMKDGYRIGLSPVYKSQRGYYSYYHADRAGSAKYWAPRGNGAWKTAPDKYTWSVDPVTQLTWQEVWETLRLDYVNTQFFERARAKDSSLPAVYSNGGMKDVMTVASPMAVKNARLQSLCTLAKEQGVIIYSIAFNASPEGRDQLATCASSTAHFFLTSIPDIAATFSMIATNIVRLTK